MRKTHINATPNVDGSRNVSFRSRESGWIPAGRLMPRIDQATAEASPAIQSWSHPRGKVSTELFDESSVARFAKHWEKKWRTTYPLDVTNG